MDAPSVENVDATATNAQALISGWGRTSAGGPKANALQIANVTVWDNNGSWAAIAAAAFPASVDGTVSSCQVSHLEFPGFSFSPILSSPEKSTFALSGRLGRAAGLAERRPLRGLRRRFVRPGRLQRGGFPRDLRRRLPSEAVDCGQDWRRMLVS